MLKGKKFTDYLAYAIGEIILVVIGILIALYINNWNKNQQTEIAKQDLQDKILVQLDNDLLQIENFRKELDTLNNIYLKYLGRDFDEKKVANKNVFSTILFEVTDLGLDQHALNWIDNAELDSSNQSQELIDISNLYRLYFKNIDDYENVIYKKITSNLEILESTQPWYTDLITEFKCGLDCLEYISNDKDHKARVASLRFLYISAYGDLINGFYYDLKGAKRDLEQVKKAS